MQQGGHILSNHSAADQAGAGHVGDLCFYWNWDDFLAPLIYLNNPKLYTISLALRSFADPASVTNWGQSSRWDSLR